MVYNLHCVFVFRYKLERGSLSAFKREAGNIIERDLPLILHRDNIIKVFADKVSKYRIKSLGFSKIRHFSKLDNSILYLDAMPKWD